MPVVPFSPLPPQEPKSREFTPAQEPWALMAAAQMDSEGRLLSIDDRRDQGLKERDNEMVNDQLRSEAAKQSWLKLDDSYVNQITDEYIARKSKLGRQLGSEDLER